MKQHIFHFAKKARQSRILYLIIPLLALAAIAMLVAAYNYRGILNPDGVAYLSIAEHYANGHFKEAINAYWSPMISWLMVPFIVVGISPQSSFALVNAAASFSVIALGIVLLRRRFKAHGVGVILYTLFTLPFLLFAQTQVITPDILVMAVVLLVLLVLDVAYEKLSMLKTSNWKSYALPSALIAAAGVLAYLTKLFLLPFFVVLVVIWFLIFAWQQYGRRLKQLAVWRTLLSLPLLIVGFFLLFSAPWLGALAAKYGYLTFGSSTGFNVAAKSPDYPGNPIRLGLTEPPHRYAVTAWEDPTLLRYKTFNPTSNSRALDGYIKQRLAVIAPNIVMVSKMAPMALGVIVGISLAVLAGWLTWRRHRMYILSLLGLVVYWGGYLAVASTNQRYFWPVYILSALLLAAGVSMAWRSSGSRLRRVGLGVFVALLVGGVTLFYPPNYAFKAGYVDGSRVTADAIKAKSVLNDSSRLAGNAFYSTAAIGYYLQLPTYGTIGKARYADDAIQRQLKEYGVTHFLYFSESRQLDPEAGFTEADAVARIPNGGGYLYILEVK